MLVGRLGDLQQRAIRPSAGQYGRVRNRTRKSFPGRVQAIAEFKDPGMAGVSGHDEHIVIHLHSNVDRPAAPAFRQISGKFYPMDCDSPQGQEGGIVRS